LAEHEGGKRRNEPKTTKSLFLSAWGGDSELEGAYGRESEEGEYQESRELSPKRPQSADGELRYSGHWEVPLTKPLGGRGDNRRQRKFIWERLKSRLVYRQQEQGG